MEIEIRIVATPNVDRPELGQYFEATEPYTGCGCIHYYFDRSTFTSASECDGNIRYGAGMGELPKWQHPLIALAVKANISWDEVYSTYLKVSREHDTRSIKDRLSYETLLSITEERVLTRK